MGLLSSCKEAPLIAVCDLCEDDPKAKRTVQAALPQVLAAAAQQVPRLYPEGRTRREETEEQEEPRRVVAAEGEEAVEQAAEPSHSERLGPLRAAAAVGLLESCLPRRGVAECCHEMQEHIEADSGCQESMEERLYFERLEAASRLAREEELRQQEEEEERERIEEAEQAIVVARRKAQREARERSRREQEKVSAFLKANGFGGVTAKRKRLFASCYPLHLAVEENSPEMVQLLLQAGADRCQKNSLGQTPEALASRRNRSGSHDQVLALLRPQGAPQVQGSLQTVN